MFNRNKNNKAYSIIFYRTLIGLSNRLTQYIIPIFIIFLNWNDFYYGLILAVAGYLASGLIIGVGYITDVKKRKYTMIAGLGAAGLSMFLFYGASFTEVKGLMIAAYSLFGVSRSMTQISLTTLLADVTPSKEEKTKFFGFMHFFWNMAGVVAPLIGGAYLTIYANYRTHYGSFSAFNGGSFSAFHLIADKSPYMNIILFIAIFLIITMFLTFRFPIPDTSKEEAKEISRGEDWKKYENGSKKPIGFQLLAFFFCEAIIGFTSGVAIPFIMKYMIVNLSASD
ncbi:MAG: MFS transporter, partial [Candidatus Heimdallarchaeaceae archaeon]